MRSTNDTCSYLVDSYNIVINVYSSLEILSTPWPMFRQNLQHTGTTPEAVVPPLVKLWSYKTGAQEPTKSQMPSPAVLGGRLYIGGSNLNDYNLYALNAITGAKLWSFKTNGHISSSPTVSGGIVYIQSADTNVYALDATTGTKVWNFTHGGSGNPIISSSPAVSDGIVYVGTHDQNVYALNATTGAKIWSFNIGTDIYSSPAVSSGAVYVGSLDGNVYAFGSEPIVHPPHPPHPPQPGPIITVGGVE